MEFFFPDFEIMTIDLSDSTFRIINLSDYQPFRLTTFRTSDLTPFKIMAIT